MTSTLLTEVVIFHGQITIVKIRILELKKPIGVIPRAYSIQISMSYLKSILVKVDFRVDSEYKDIRTGNLGLNGQSLDYSI